MSIRNCPIGMDGYVAKYIDRMGCTLEEACEQLEISCDDVFKPDEFIDKY